MFEVPFFMAYWQYAGAFVFFAWVLPLLKEILRDERARTSFPKTTRQFFHLVDIYLQD